MTKRWLGLLLAVLAVLAATPATAGASLPAKSHGGAATNSETTFGIQPSGPKHVDARGYFSYNATPGGHIADFAAITNYSLHAISLGIYSTDAVNTPTGGFALLSTADKPKDVGTWIELPTNIRQLAIRARTTAIIPFRVVVPRNASPGDHAGGIAVVLTSYATSSTGQRYRLFQTVGTRMFVRVTGPLHPRLTIENLSATYHGVINPFGEGTATVTYVVHNTGNVAMGASQSVSVSSIFGAVQARPLRVPLLLPGGSAAESVVVRHVFPAVLLRATVRLRPLILPGSIQPRSGPFTASAYFWAIPWLLLLLIFLVLLSVAIFIRQRRRRRAAHRKADADSPAGRHRKSTRVKEPIP